MHPEKKMTEIDPNKLQAFIDGSGLTKTDIGRKCGYAGNWLQSCIVRRAMSRNGQRSLEMAFGLEEGYFKPEPKPVEEPQVSLFQPGWSMGLKTYPNKVLVTLCFDGEVVKKAWGSVAGDSELDLIAGINYATHRIYDQCKQDQLEKE